jgi:probable F420-dependent oxidoreductase
MKFWHSVTAEPLDQRCELAQTMEQLGFTGAAVGDHLVTPADTRSPYPYTADHKAPFNPATLFPDPWQTISVMASATSSLHFLTSIYILPLRDVLTVAKSLSTAAVISNNRVIFGAGMGWMEEEFALTGQSFKNRGARADEMIDIIRAFMKDGMAEYHGKYHDFPLVHMAPVPGRAVPIVIGGETDAAMRRAAGLDGWITAPRRAEEFEELLHRFNAARRALGRHDHPMRIFAIVKGEPKPDDCRQLADLGITDVMLTSAHLADRGVMTLDAKKHHFEDLAERLIRYF